MTCTPRQKATRSRISLAASFVCTLESQENLLDLMFVGDRAYTFTAGVGQLHTDGMMEVLAGVQPCIDGTLGDLRQAVLEQRDRLSGCVLILLAWDRERQDLVDELIALDLPVQVYRIAAQGAEDLDAAGGPLQILHAGRIQQELLGA